MQFIGIFLLAVGYLAIIGSLVWVNHRWRQHLHAQALSGLDYESRITDAEYQAAQNTPTETTEVNSHGVDQIS